MYENPRNESVDTDAVELIALLMQDQKAVYYSNEAKDPDSSTAAETTHATQQGTFSAKRRDHVQT